MSEEPKPVNPPRRWNMKDRFVDETGQIFEFGKYVGKESDEEIG